MTMSLIELALRNERVASRESPVIRIVMLKNNLRFRRRTDSETDGYLAETHATYATFFTARKNIYPWA
jgi:hypothetical protein